MAIRSLALAFVACLAACGGGGDSGAAPPASSFAGGAVNLDFAAQADALPIDCSTALPNLGTSRATGALQDLRFYVSNVRFVRADGSEQPLTLTVAPGSDPWNARLGSDSLTLIDLENGVAQCAGGTTATNARVAGTVPAGNYVAVRFTLGVPDAMNRLDPLAAGTPPALAVTALYRSSGRLFAKVDVADAPGATVWAPFPVHLGAYGCTSPGVCNRPNRATVTLGSTAAPFDPTRQRVVFDVAALLAGSHVELNRSSAPGCQSSPFDLECEPVFQALQLGLNDGLPINGGLAQTVFRATAR